MSLGDIALSRSEHEEARQRYDEALSLYLRIPEPYSIGMTHRRLARLATTPTERQQHVRAARDAWAKIKRDDLIDALVQEFKDIDLS